MGKKWWSRGSFTVEAALVVPFGFLVLMSLSCLFGILLRQNDIQLGMVRAVQTCRGGKGSLSSLELMRSEHVLLQWSDTAEGKRCYVDRFEEIPFLGSRFLKLHCYQQMVASDYGGVSMVSGESGDELVYVAENGTVYHLDRECTYLRVRIRTVTVRRLETTRNQSGGIYYPCESCCASCPQSADTAVYIASYGVRYHIQSGCPKLKRTVRTVHLSEVGNLPVCSKCGGE